ncbi:MAG: electron transfer flavoprotein subunit alpha/FixB family protein [Desulfobacteraceae bacterium]|nr:electron transfer flavoprotein subunit alpha/FixB family protein [Desulfobacteraceae bacterium]
MAQIFAYIPHQDGVAEDIAYEFQAAAAKLDSDAQVTAVVTGSGDTLDKVAEQLTATFKEVIKIGHDDLAYPNAEVVRKALCNVLPADAIVLTSHNTFGMDLVPGLSIKLDSACASDVIGFEGTEGTTVKVIRQVLGGIVSTHNDLDISNGAVIAIRPGAFTPDEDGAEGGTIVDKSGDAGDLLTKRRFLEIVEAEIGDVDITKSDVLVSIGRGIEEEENIEIAEELAEAMGAVVSCSRPIVDANWLEKSRQVGTSGLTVKPKVYLAMGISGSFQHLGGLKGDPFIIAINKNVNAPIFQVADVGIVEDILEFMPELTEKIKEL